MSRATGTPGYTQEWVDRSGDRIGLHRYPAPESPATATVVVWPAMGVPARYYHPFATRLHAAGCQVTVADLRGTGSSTPRPSRASRYGYLDLVADVGAVLDTLTPTTDGRPLLLLGHSLSGQTCALHLAMRPDSPVDGLVLVAVGLPYWRDYPGRSAHAIRFATRGINAASALLGVWPGWGFGGRQARGVIRDWAHTARTGRFPVLDGVDVESALAKVRTPVLAVTIDDDGYTPPSTMDRLCGKLVSAPVAREHYTAAQAGGPLDHFSWVRSAGPLATRIAAFATDIPASRPTP